MNRAFLVAAAVACIASMQASAQEPATEPARRFRIRIKGTVAPGMDADLTLVDLHRHVTLTAGALHQRHPLTPYLGRSFRGLVRRTIRRGVTIFNDGRITATTGGALVRPS